jgi:hypothetical protein
MEWKTINTERAKELEAASDELLQFTVLDNKVIGVVFEGPEGPISVKIDSYSVNVCEVNKKKVWRLTTRIETRDFENREDAVRAAFDYEGEAVVKQVTIEG